MVPEAISCHRSSSASLDIKSSVWHLKVSGLNMPGRIWGQWRCFFSTCTLWSSAITDPLSPLLLQVCLVFPNASVRHDYARIRFSLDLKLQLSRAGGFSHCFPLLVSVPDALLWKTAQLHTFLSDKLNRMCKRQESPLSDWYNNCITSLKKARKLINMELLSLKFTVPSCFWFFFFSIWRRFPAWLWNTDMV